MLRSLYACIVRLHPKRFRERFGEEMLWIYDEALRSRGAGALIVDGCVSLVRQWAFRNAEEEEPVAAGVSDVPLFATGVGSGPRPAALAQGVLLSVLAFAAVSLSIGHWRGPRVIHYTGGWTLFGDFKREAAGEPSARTVRDMIEELRRGAAGPRTALAGATNATAMPQPAGAAGTAVAQGAASERTAGAGAVQAALMAALDRNGDGKVTPEEAAAAGILKDATAEAGQTSVAAPAGTRTAPHISAAQAALIMFVLDRNRDGKITDDEWQALWKLMERADTNKDGVVTLEELCAAPPM